MSFVGEWFISQKQWKKSFENYQMEIFFNFNFF